MKPFALIIFPLLFLVVTGVIYSNYLSWTGSCQSQLPCNATFAGPNDIPMTDPLFNLMRGDYVALFSSITTRAFASPINIPIGAAGSFGIPWVSWTPSDILWSSWDIGTIPNPLGGGWPVAIPYPYLSCPLPAGTSDAGNYVWDVVHGFYVWQPNAFCPILYTPKYPLGNPPSIAIGAPAQLVVLGILMLVFGLGIGVSAIGAGISINDQGTKLLQLMGIGLILWAFITLFTSTWLTVLDSEFTGIGTFITTVLALMFFIGIYWQSQTSL